MKLHNTMYFLFAALRQMGLSCSRLQHKLSVAQCYYTRALQLLDSLRDDEKLKVQRAVGEWLNCRKKLVLVAWWESVISMYCTLLTCYQWWWC